MNAVKTENLSKYFSRGRIKALDDFSIEIDQGKIFSLLGPNGAGKTTLIKTLLNIIHPTSGSALVLGEPINNYRIHKQIGYLAENHRFPEFLTAGQVLHYYGKMSGIEFNMLCKDGSLVTVCFDGRIGYDEQGHFIQMHCILQDLTEKNKNAAIEESYGNIFENSLNEIFVFDAVTFKFIKVNRGACKIWVTRKKS